MDSTVSAARIPLNYLIQGAIYQIDFLQQVNDYPLLYGGKILANAIRRYEELWLPLVADVGDLVVYPPLDVHWVWHCHMLAPLAYEKDCTRLVDRIPDHVLLGKDTQNFRDALSTGRVVWQQRYEEPFEIDMTSDAWIAEAARYFPKCEYDLAAAARRQKEFFYQVSLPHFREGAFLGTALERYRKYLHLKSKNPKVFLVPCYDIDLIWHTHQLHPLKYREDTHSLLGRVLNHDDSVNDRSPGSKLNQSDDITRELWKETFREDFRVSGAMFRGESPVGNLFFIHPQVLYGMSSKTGKLSVREISVSSNE